MTANSVLCDLAHAMAFMHAHEAPEVVLAVIDVQHGIGREDVTLAVQVADVFAVGENPGRVIGDALEGGRRPRRGMSGRPPVSSPARKPRAAADRGLLRCNWGAAPRPAGRHRAGQEGGRSEGAIWKMSGRPWDGSGKCARNAGRTLPHAFPADLAGWRPASHAHYGTAGAWLPADGSAAGRVPAGVESLGWRSVRAQTPSPMIGLGVPIADRFTTRPSGDGIEVYAVWS